MTPRSLIWRGALAALLVATLAATAIAQPKKRDRDRDRERDTPRGECKDKLNAAGRAKFRPFTQAREARGEGAAMADAIANWQRDVSAKYGSQWMLWEKADDKDFKCGASRPGKIGSWFIRCTIEARPCGGGPEGGEEPEPGPGKLCNDYSSGRILEAQQRMNGCNACNRQIPVDGRCAGNPNGQTESCLRIFQTSRFGRRHNLEVTNAPDRKTMEALREYCNS